MAGRPRKPVALKAAQGDTRKIGALRFAEEMAGTFVALRGRPPMPESLMERELPRDADDAMVEAEVRREAALKHWEYLCSTLESDGLLCVHDGGVLAGMAWNYALQMELWAAGDSKQAALLQNEYRRSALEVGLTEVARARMTKPSKPQMNEMDLALAGGLPEDEQPIQ